MTDINDMFKNLGDTNMTQYIALAIGILFVLALMGYVASNVEKRKNKEKILNNK